MEKYVVGVDLGGTKIFTALCDMRGSIVAEFKTGTESASGKENVIQKIKDSIYRVLETSSIPLEQVASIGISSPGPLNVSKGVIVQAATLKWDNVPLSSIIQNEFKVPVYLENDANAACFGEMCLGAGRGFDNIVYITVSTGIGCGIIIDGKIYHGKHDAAGELGHICVEFDGTECNCGNRGCLEMYASGTAIARIARERVIRERNSRVMEYCNNIIDDIDCIAVEKAAYEGDRLANEVWHEAGTRLGQGISILMQMLDPDIVIIGGGVSKAWKLFYEPMIDTIKKKTYKSISGDMLIVRAQLGGNAGVQGAAMIAAMEHRLDKNGIVRQKIL